MGSFPTVKTQVLCLAAPFTMALIPLVQPAVILIWYYPGSQKTVFCGFLLVVLPSVVSIDMVPISYYVRFFNVTYSYGQYFSGTAL